jgi:hypothetical protein
VNDAAVILVYGMVIGLATIPLTLQLLMGELVWRDLRDNPNLPG